MKSAETEPCEFDDQDSARLCQDGVLSVMDAAAFLGCRKTVVYDLMNKRILPWTKVLGRRKIPKKSLVEYLSANMQVATK